MVLHIITIGYGNAMRKKIIARKIIVVDKFLFESKIFCLKECGKLCSIVLAQN